MSALSDFVTYLAQAYDCGLIASITLAGAQTWLCSPRDGGPEAEWPAVVAAPMPIDALRNAHALIVSRIDTHPRALAEELAMVRRAMQFAAAGIIVIGKDRWPDEQMRCEVHSLLTNGRRHLFGAAAVGDAASLVGFAFRLAMVTRAAPVVLPAGKC